MKSSTTLQLMLAVSGVSAVSIPVHNREASSNVARGPLEVTDNYVRLSKSAKYPHLESLVRRASSEKGLVSLAANPSYPVAEVQFAGETIPMLIDTGSSDIWVVKKGFKCVEKDGTETKAADCYIPKPFDHTPTGGYVKGANLSITYGDESFVLGPMALEDVTIGGIKVPSQQIGIADIVSTGAGGRDSSYSGLMGVSYSYLTSQVDAVTGKAAGEYTSIMTNMVEKKLATSFAMALDRGVDKGGYMAFGGLPPVETISDWVSTPILKKNVTDEHNKTSAQYTGYFAKVNRIVLRHGSDGSIPTNYNVTNDFKWSDPVRVLVDSGTALTTLPMHLVSHIMTAYDPPARLRVVEDDPDSFYVVCNAKPPFLGAQFNNEAGSGVMWIDDNDLILQDTKAKVNGKDYCLTGIQATDGTPILGDTWMHNVVAVFDVGNSTMHFAQRPQY